MYTLRQISPQHTKQTFQTNALYLPPPRVDAFVVYPRHSLLHRRIQQDLPPPTSSFQHYRRPLGARRSLATCGRVMFAQPLCARGGTLINLHNAGAWFPNVIVPSDQSVYSSAHCAPLSHKTHPSGPTFQLQTAPNLDENNHNSKNTQQSIKKN